MLPRYSLLAHPYTRCRLGCHSLWMRFAVYLLRTTTQLILPPFCLNSFLPAGYYTRTSFTAMLPHCRHGSGFGLLVTVHLRSTSCYLPVCPHRTPTAPSGCGCNTAYLSSSALPPLPTRIHRTVATPAGSPFTLRATRLPHLPHYAPTTARAYIPLLPVRFPHARTAATTYFACTRCLFFFLPFCVAWIWLVLGYCVG